MKVAILGSTGMLGKGVSEVLKGNYEVYHSYRKEEFKNLNKNSFYFEAGKSTFDQIPKVDYIINCIGVIKPYMGDLEQAININSLFPRKLSLYCLENDIKLLHITTDCVYSGKKGEYVESDLHDCLDSYGKTKSLGEASDCMVLRTSIIGEELHSNVSLVSWFLSSKGKKIQGYENHLWNGLTTKEYGRVCKQIIDNNLYEKGLYHVFSKEDVTKYQLLTMFKEKYKLNIEVEPSNGLTSCNRTLRTEKDLANKLQIKPIFQQILEM